MKNPAFLLLLVEEWSLSAKDIWSVMGPALATIVTAGFMAWRNRRRDGAGVHLTETEIRKADADLLVLNATKFDEFLQKLYDAKMLAIKSEEELADCRRALKDCEDEKGDCKEFRLKVTEFFCRAGDALQNFVDDPVLREFEDLRMSLKPKTALVEPQIVEGEKI